MTDLSDAQRRELDDYFGRIASGDLVQAYVYGAYKSWCKRNDKNPVSAEALRLWVRGERKPTKFNNFYEFVAEENEIGRGNQEVTLVKSINRLFLTRHSNSDEMLGRLVGEYKIIRKLWAPAYSEDLLECPVKFYNSPAGVLFEEKEEFNSGYSVKEQYKGYTFLFGSSVWIIAHEEKANAIKFMTIHEFTPPLLSGSTPINICKGTLIAVSGRGPNVSHRFILRRVSYPLQSCRITSKNQIKLDREDKEYLYVNDEEEARR